MWNVSPVPPLPTSLLFSLTKHGQSYESRAVHIDTRTFAHIMNILKQEEKNTQRDKKVQNVRWGMRRGETFQKSVTDRNADVQN